MRITVAAGVVRILVLHGGKRWPLLRSPRFSDAPAYHGGPMCCSPKREGLLVEFPDFTAGPPLRQDLHDLS
ncbi:MAG: DUF1349 domain-containing protein [Oxalobacteraceae bacterium]|nr:MAG: DUF1349 domain-containing protein [Oxalobacteraceae bacterium]